jgi:hypothetical protein
MAANMDGIPREQLDDAFMERVAGMRSVIDTNGDEVQEQSLWSDQFCL